jgi:hypothetical protein
VAASGLGYWLFVPKMPSQVATTMQTSSMSSSQTVTLTSTSSALTSSTTVLAQWINVTATKPVSYYLGLLESNRTEPYVQLGTELRKLPDATNATAAAKITYLALNSTNPEVKEAFQLMMNGGTPDPRDFTYIVPNYNTELQVLYWLAEQNEFKKDDTLALAIAMVNGLWITMGTNDVAAAVRNDTSSLLAFLRDTNVLQESRGYFSLEDLPLEAKIQLAWTGEESMRHGYGPPIGLIYWTKQRLSLAIYDADTVNVTTLAQMRAEADKNGWVQPRAGVESLVSYVEDYLFFPSGPHFNYRTDYSNIVNGQGIMAVHDVDWQWAQHEKGLKFQGDCGTEMTIVDAWLKSWGIATVSEWAYTLFTQHNMEKLSHSFIIYYEPATRTWTAYYKQITEEFQPAIAEIGGNTSQPFDMFICRPPVIQQGYLHEETFSSRTINGIYYASYWHFEGNMYYQIELAPWMKLEKILANGIPTDTMKQLLLDRSYGSLSIAEPSMMFKIDGYGNDWVNFTAVMSKGATQSITPGRDLEEVYAVADGKYLYVMIKLFGPPDPGNNYIIPLDLTGSGKWDYSLGFNTNSTWMYDLRGIPNGQWPDSRLATPYAVYAVASVAEIAIPLEIIGNPSRINIADVWIYYPSLGRDVDDFGMSASVPFITDTTSTSIPHISQLTVQRNRTACLHVLVPDSRMRARCRCYRTSCQSAPTN